MLFAVFLPTGSVPQGYNDWFAIWTVGVNDHDPTPRESVPISDVLLFPNVPPGPGSIQVLLRVVDRPTGQILFESGWLRSGTVMPDRNSTWEFNMTSGLFRQTLPEPGPTPSASPPAQARRLNVQYAKVQVSSG